MVHDAAQGYDNADAQRAQSSGRPSYHPDLIASVRALLEGTSRIVELGAGSGRLTTELHDLPIEAVEPIAAMRDTFGAAVPTVPIIDGSAEKLPYDDGMVDAVVCGQSFHWFNYGPALDEIQRVLTSGGLLMLVWNVRDDDVAWVQHYDEVQEPYAGDTPRHVSMKWRRALEQHVGFGPIEDTVIPYPWPTTRQGA